MAEIWGHISTNNGLVGKNGNSQNVQSAATFDVKCRFKKYTDKYLTRPNAMFVYIKEDIPNAKDRTFEVVVESEIDEFAVPFINGQLATETFDVRYKRKGSVQTATMLLLDDYKGLLEHKFLFEVRKVKDDEYSNKK